jgi:hypothetical protein
MASRLAGSTALFGALTAISALTALVATVSVTAGCGGTKPRTCDVSAACGAGEACVLGRCSGAASPAPIQADARRYVLEPETLAFVTTGDDEGRVRPPYVALGAEVGDSARILVKFPAPKWTSDKVVRAYLVLDRVQGAQAGPGDVEVRAERVVEPWSLRGEAGTTWASPPRSESMAGAKALAAPRGSAPIRIDVTPYAVELARKGATSWGLRIEARGAGYGVPIATGFGATGAPPRLEVYVQP